MERTKSESEYLSEDRLKELCSGEPKSTRAWVVFDEGKIMAEEILFLRAEVARLSKTNPN